MAGDHRSSGSATDVTKDLTKRQVKTCARFGVSPLPVGLMEIAGVSADVGSGLLPLNALRHRPEGGTTGWYLWAGETLSDADDFFKPLHVIHLVERCPQVLDYLALPPGWRVLLAPRYEDVWRDDSLLDI